MGVPAAWVASRKSCISDGSARCSRTSGSPKPTWNCTGSPVSTPVQIRCLSSTGASRRAAGVGLGGAGVGGAVEGGGGGGGRFQVKERRAPAPHRETQRAVEHGRARRRRAGGLGEQRLEARAVERDGDDTVAVVIDQHQ